MIKKIITALFLGSFFLLPRAFSQISDMSITIDDFEFTDNYKDIRSNKHGIKIQMDLRFSQVIDDFSTRASFKLYWRLDDMNGKTVYESREQQVSSDRYESLSPRQPYNDSNADYMLSERERLFIPYALMDLPEGEQHLKLVLTAESKSSYHKDFASKEIHFFHRNITLYGFEAQEFTVRDFVIEKDADGFGVKDPGLEFRFALDLKYGSDEISSKRYEFDWAIRDLAGKTLYQSSDASSIHHRDEGISPTNIKGKTVSRIKMFTEYGDIDMDGPGEVMIVITARADGEGRKEIYSQKHFLDVPEKYRFEEQEFTVGEVIAKESRNEGSGGLAIDLPVQFKFFGPRADPDRGSYYVYVVLEDAQGKKVYSHKMESEHSRGSTQGWDSHNPTTTSHGPVFNLFVPYYRLKLSKGEYKLKYKVFVSDKDMVAKFPMLAEGTVTIHQPTMVEYEINVKRFTIRPGDYDSAFGGFGNKKPDLSWRLMVGADSRYSSGKFKNSLSAPGGTKILRFAKGDQLSIKLWDIDSGFFNNSDFLGEWIFPYEKNGPEFTYKVEKQGIIVDLEVDLKKLSEK